MLCWVTLYRADDYDAFAVEDADIRLAIDELNDAMVEAGVRVFVGGLRPLDAGGAIVEKDGEVVEVKKGAYRLTGEHVGGFWVLDVKDLDEGMAWGKKAAVACRASVEVRPFY